MPLSENELSELRRRMDEQEALLREDIDRELGMRDDFRAVAGDVPDPGDQATADLMLDLNHAEVSRDVTELREIEAARQRMQEGDYGYCQQCGDEIPLERLQVQPTASRCVPCQAVREKTFAEPGRGATL